MTSRSAFFSRAFCWITFVNRSLDVAAVVSRCWATAASATEHRCASQMMTCSSLRLGELPLSCGRLLDSTDRVPFRFCAYVNSSAASWSILLLISSDVVGQQGTCWPSPLNTAFSCNCREAIKLQEPVFNDPSMLRSIMWMTPQVADRCGIIIILYVRLSTLCIFSSLCYRRWTVARDNLFSSSLVHRDSCHYKDLWTRCRRTWKHEEN